MFQIKLLTSLTTETLTKQSIKKLVSQFGSQSLLERSLSLTKFRTTLVRLSIASHPPQLFSCRTKAQLNSCVIVSGVRML